MDISDDKKKHRHARQGFKKNNERGWTFKTSNKEKNPVARVGGDGKMKIFDYEEIYTSALRSLHGDNRGLPSELKSYFRNRKSAFLTSTWVEKKRKIKSIQYEDNESPSDDGTWDHRPAPVVRWVHDNLDGHDPVIPKKRWDEREKDEFVLLDL